MRRFARNLYASTAVSQIRRGALGGVRCGWTARVEKWARKVERFAPVALRQKTRIWHAVRRNWLDEAALTSLEAKRLLEEVQGIDRPPTKKKN